MKLIALTKGKVALVDDEDYERINSYKWQYCVESSIGYALHARTRRRGRNPSLRMHRLVMNAPEGVHVDHWNGDGIDNRKVNLRLAGDSENQQNRHRLPMNTSGYRGVTFHKQCGRWQACIKRHGKSYYLGLHSTPEMAAMAYDQGALKHYGKGARLNFPKEAA